MNLFSGFDIVSYFKQKGITAALGRLESILSSAQLVDVEGVQLVSLDPQNLTSLGSGVFRIDVPIYEPPLEATVGLSAAAEPLSGKAQLLVI